MNISNAPDGTLYIADMYHGIIQERQWSGPGTYLRAKIEQYQLDKVAAHGRIWRLRYDGRAARAGDRNQHRPAGDSGDRADFAPPKMYSETPAQLVTHLSHPNGWRRDMAQRLLILKQDKSVVPALQQTGRVVAARRARRSHGGGSCWRGSTRCGRSKGSARSMPALVREAMKDENPRMRVQAIRASETLYKAGDKSFADDYRALTKDADSNVVIQAMLTLNLFKLPDAADLIKAAQAANKAKGVALVGERLLAPAAAASAAAAAARHDRRGREAAAAGRRRVRRGVLLVPRSGRQGAAMEAPAPATMLAPPLAGSPRVQGHRDYVIKVLLNGLTGPLDGKTYRDVMVPMGGHATSGSPASRRTSAAASATAAAS